MSAVAQVQRISLPCRDDCLRIHCGTGSAARSGGVLTARCVRGRLDESTTPAGRLGPLLPLKCEVI